MGPVGLIARSWIGECVFAVEPEPVSRSRAGVSNETGVVSVTIGGQKRRSGFPIPFNDELNAATGGSPNTCVCSAYVLSGLNDLDADGVST